MTETGNGDNTIEFYHIYNFEHVAKLTAAPPEPPAAARRTSFLAVGWLLPITQYTQLHSDFCTK